MGTPERDPRPRSGWRRRALGLYWLFIGAVVVGTGLLQAAMERNDRLAALALVATGLVFAAGFGVVVTVRVLRER